METEKTKQNNGNRRNDLEATQATVGIKFHVGREEMNNNREEVQKIENGIRNQKIKLDTEKKIKEKGKVRRKNRKWKSIQPESHNPIARTSGDWKTKRYFTCLVMELDTQLWSSP